MKLTLIVAVSAFVAASAFAGEGDGPNGSEANFHGAPIGVSTPSTNPAAYNGSETPAAQPAQNLNLAPLNCAVNGTDGSGHILLVCQNGGNG